MRPGPDLMPPADGDLTARPPVLGAAALDSVPLGAPAQHASDQVRDFLEPGLLQDCRGLGRAATGPAHRDDRPVLRQLAGAFGQFAERDQHRTPYVTQRASELVGLADIENLQTIGALGAAFPEPVRFNYHESGESVAQMRAGRFGERISAGFGPVRPAAAQVP